MIKLFESNATEFSTGGLGILTNVYECTVHSSVSGIYELNLNMGVDDDLYEHIKISNIIATKPNMTDQYQGFVIEEITKNIDGTINIYATQVAQYRAKLIPVQPFTATDIQDALSKVIANSLETNVFTLTTPRTTQVSYSLNEPRSMRDILGGVEGSLLDVYGGEYIFNNFDIQLVNRRGTDRGFDVIYGINMNEYKETSTFSWSNSITGVLPYYKSEESLVVGNIQYSQYADLYPIKKTICYDFSDKFDETPTVQELNAQAIIYLANKGLPNLNIDISFADVSTLPEYKNLYNDIDNIQLGDTITVNNWYYDRVVDTRVQELIYNVLLERYDSIVLGDVKGSINDAIRDTVLVSTNGNSVAEDELSIKDVINPTVSSGSITYHHLKYAKNIDGGKFMVWGDFSVRGAGSSVTITMDLGLQVKTPPNDIDIYGILWLYQSSANQSALPFMRIDTNGNVKLIYICSTNNTTFYVPPTVINLTNFIGV